MFQLDIPNEKIDFWIDRVQDQYKIVSLRPLWNSFMYYVPPQSCRKMDNTYFAAVEAPHLVDDTLKRFGLPVSSTQPGEVYSVGGPVTSPVPTYKPEPAYTDEARTKRVQGNMNLSVVVDANGNVGDVKVINSLEPSLDNNAVRTVRAWTFKPATRNGIPVAVRVMVEITFRL